MSKREHNDAWTELVRTAAAVHVASVAGEETATSSRWRLWLRPLVISAVTHQGVPEALRALRKVVDAAARCPDTSGSSTR